MNTSFIYKVISESERWQVRRKRKIERMKFLMKVLEDRNLNLPERFYGMLARWESEYRRECEEYQQLLNITKNEKKEERIQ